MNRLRTTTTGRMGSIRSRTTTERLFERVSTLVSRLAHFVSRREQPDSQFEEVETALATLPLASEEFAVACCRLRNAKASTARGEVGAACYELRLLARSLFAGHLS